MSRSLSMKLLTAVAVGIILLGHLSPVAAGMLLCIGEGSGPDCCGDSDESNRSRVEKSTQLLDGSDCDCCIAVDAAPSTTGASSQKASLDILSGATLLRNVNLPTETRLPGSTTGDTGESGLSSLRTIVLLI